MCRKHFAECAVHGLRCTPEQFIQFLSRVGKDEVSSSNLDSSSKKLLKSLDFGSFCSVFRENNVGQKVGQAGRALVRKKWTIDTRSAKQ